MAVVVVVVVVCVLLSGLRLRLRLQLVVGCKCVLCRCWCSSLREFDNRGCCFGVSVVVAVAVVDQVMIARRLTRRRLFAGGGFASLHAICVFDAVITPFVVVIIAAVSVVVVRKARTRFW